MRNRVRATAATAILLLFAATNARGDDWPSQGLNAARLRASTERSGASFRAQSWTYGVPGAMWSTSSPAVADGFVVFGTRDGTVHALKASTGRRIWEFTAKEGILASPAIYKGRVFVPSMDSKLYALRLSDGVVAWSKDLGGLQQSSPTIVSDSLGDSVIVAGGYPTRKLFRIDTVTGTTIWETAADDMAQFSNSAAASDGQQVIIGAQEGHLYSFDLATGAHRWTYEADGIVNQSAPLIVGDRVYLLPGGNSGRLHAVDLATGQAVSGWPIDLPLVTTDTAIAGKMLNRTYSVSSLAWVAQSLVFDVRIDDSMDTDKDAVPDQFVMREFVMALRPSDGQVVWQQANGKGTLDSTNAIPKNWLCPTPVAFQSTGTGSPLVAVASTLSSTLQTLDVASGTSRGTITLSAPSRVSPVLANGRLFVGTESGTLHANLSSVNQPPSAPVLIGNPGLPVPATAATVRWAASFDPEGDAVSYRVRVDHDGEILQNWETEVTTVAGDTSVHLSQPLQAGLTYTFAVRARDSKGAWSDWSAPQFVQAVETPAVSVGGWTQPSLAGALAAATVGSVIKLAAGTFYLTETLRVPPGVSLEGAGPQQTILDATGQATGVSLEGSVDGQPTEVKGLTVTGAQVGIAVRDAHDARIKNVIVRDNRDVGIEVSAAGSATVINATLLSNGLGVRSFGAATVKNSIVTRNQTGFVADHVDALVSKFNDVTGNVVAFQGMTRGMNDIARDVAFVDFPKRDLHVTRGQASTDQGDPADDFAQEPAPNGGRINQGAFGGTAEAELSAAPPPPTGSIPTASVGGCAVGGDVPVSPSRGLVTIVLALVAAVLVVRRRRRAAVVVVLLACLTPRPSEAITCTWKSSSGGSGGAFSTAANWVLSGTGGNAACPPGSNDTAAFSSGSQACTLTANVSVNTLTTSSTYSGAISQGTNSITTAAALNMGAGTFTGGSNDIVIGTDLNLSGGAFTSTSGMLKVGGAFNDTGGTFTHNSGTVLLTSTSNKSFASNGAAFYDLFITDGLVGYWKLDETSGTTAADSSGYANSGTHTGSPTISATVPTLDFSDARSVQFNGATPNYIQTGTLPTELMPSVVTVAAWYKATGVDSGGSDIVSGSNRYVLRIGTSGATSLVKQTGSGTWVFATATVASNLDGNWHHIAGTITGTTMTLYFDGTSVATTSDSTALYYTSPTGLAIGRNPISATQDFTGNIDDVRVYNRALSAADIASLAAGSQPTTSVATQTLTGNPSVAHDLTIGSGALAAGNTTISVAGSWWNYGGIFTTGTSGTVNFNGSVSGKTILAAGSDFNNLTISGSGAWTLSDKSLLMVDNNLSQSAGTFTTAATLLEVDGSFNQTAGTFTQSAGRTLLGSSTSQTFGAGGTTTFNNLTINDGLVGYWKLDENTGTTLADQSGRANDGTLVSGSWTSGSLPSVNFANTSAVSFNGTSTYATLGTSNLPALNGSKTIAAWLYWASKPGAASNAIVLKAGGSYLQMGFYTTTGLIKVWGDSGSLVVGSASTPTSGWHHVAYTYDGTTNSLYIDGGAPATSATAPLSGSTTAAYLGSYDGAHEFWPGYIDDVRIYNRVLTATEINSLAIGNQPGSASATHTLSGDMTVNGDLVIASGKLDASTNNLTVGGSWWNYGGLFTASSSGSVTFNGSSSGKLIRSAGQAFGGVTINGSGSWTLGDRMEFNPGSVLTMTAGTLSLSTYTVRGGNVNNNGVALTPNTGKVVLDGNTSFTADQGSFKDLRFEPVAATDLIGYWKLDAGQGTTARDFSSGGNDLTLTGGPVWTNTGLASGIKFDNPAAVTFDGTSTQQYAKTASFPSSLQPSVVTVSAWYKATSVDAGSSASDIVSGSNRYVLRLSSTGVQLVKQTASGTWAFATGTSATTLDGNWHHVAGTISGTTMTVYYDGVSLATTADSNAIYYTSPTYLAIGRNPTSSTQDFNGTIDDVRVYDVALTAAQVAALARGTYPAGLSGTPTYTLGANTTVSGTLAVDSGTVATSSYTMNASSTSGAATVYSGTYSVGSTTNTFAGGLTVNTDGTLSMPTSGGAVQIGSTKTLTIDGTLSASSTGATIQTAGSAGTYYTFTVGSTATATPTLNITGLAVKNPDTNGMNINVNHSASTTFTRFDNIAFSGGPTTAGGSLLQIYAPTLYLVSNGCTFTHTATTYNVTLTGDTSSATETRAYFGNTTCSPTTCEAYDNDDDANTDGAGDHMTTNGSVIQWVHAAMADTSGTIEGFPTSAFDWNTFTYYSTYVTYHDVGGGTADRIYVRSTNGAALYSWDTPTGVDLIGTPRYDTVSSVHYVYVATTSGKIYRLIDNGSSSLTQDNTGSWAGANNPYDCSCTITTPLTLDTNNVYWGGTASGNKVWTLAKTTRTLASSSPYSALSVISGAAPTVWTDSNSHVQMFMGSSAHFYKVDINTQTITTDNSSPTGTVNGRISIINNRVYGADNRGSLWVLDPATFSTTLWSYHDNTNHNGCLSGDTCAITGSLYVDSSLNRAFYGDSDGHLYASYNTTGTTGGQATGWPYSTGNTSDVFATAPFYNAGIVVAGSTIGNLYIIDVNGGSGPVLKQTYKFGTATSVSGVGYDKGSASYMIATSNATNKDGKLIYIDAMADPTSGSN